MGLWSNAKEKAKELLGLDEIDESIDWLIEQRIMIQGFINERPNSPNRPMWEAQIAQIDESLNLYGIDLTDGLTADDWDEVLLAAPQAAFDLFQEGAEEIVGEIGDLSLAFVRGFAGAFIEGLESAYDLVAQRLSGKEPEVIASITAGVLVILVSVFLWGEVRRGPKGD